MWIEIVAASLARAALIASGVGAAELAPRGRVDDAAQVVAATTASMSASSAGPSRAGPGSAFRSSTALK